MQKIKVHGIDAFPVINLHLITTAVLGDETPPCSFKNILF